MMRSVVLGAVCVALVALLACGSASSFRVSKLLQKEWQAYKKQYGKVYGTSEEDDRRLDQFMESRYRIRSLRGHESHQRGLNHMSDWTEDELNKLNGARLPEGALAEPNRADNSLEAERFLQAILDDPAPVPEQLDWRNVTGRVTDVKDQGMCGSCWAFSTTGLLEGQELTRLNGTIESKGIIALSEQDVMDCTAKYGGCDGGWPQAGLDKLATLGGIESESDYPYSDFGVIQPCKFAKKQSVLANNGSAILTKFNEDEMKQVVAKYGPISALVDATDWSDYKSGIFDKHMASYETINHAVLLVGYGSDPKEGKYWIVKNSWGFDWGEKGYMRLRRDNNSCNVGYSPLIATF